MFHNYFYLKRLSNALDLRLKGLKLVECFSQNKDELVLAFTGVEDFFIKASLLPEICLLQFPQDFKKANKNYVDLYPEITDLTVKDVSVYSFERSFKISLEDNYDIIFKMHGSRSNILIAHHDQIKHIFKSQLKNDLLIDPKKDLGQELIPDRERFNECNGNLREFIPALGKEARQFLESRDYTNKSMDDQWVLVTDLLSQLESNPIWIYRDKQFKLTLLKPEKEIVLETEDPIRAANELYSRFTFNHYLSAEKSDALKQIDKAIEKAKNYVQTSSRKLEEIKTRRNYEEIANLIMANLHQISSGSKMVILQDFYREGKIEVKLNPNLSPQKNAEQFYRKSKNQKKEIDILHQNIDQKKVQLEGLERKRKVIEELEDLKSLRKEAPVNQAKAEERSNPFIRFEFMGYDILVGKNARQNDELTLKYATKNDLWLHAKDVSGSHVVIKTHPGKNFPEPVIERAAELAAWYSKRKTDSLCPVIYTPKKFVRKRKGDPPGAVVVECEEIIMVRPKGMD